MEERGDVIESGDVDCNTGEDIDEDEGEKDKTEPFESGDLMERADGRGPSLSSFFFSLSISLSLSFSSL